MADQPSQDQSGQPAAAPAGRKGRRGYAGQAYEFGAASSLQQQAPGGQPAPNYDTYAYPSENHGYAQGGFTAPAVGGDQQPQYGQPPAANMGGYQAPAPGYPAGMGGITQGMGNMTMGGPAPAAAPVSIGGQQQKMALNPLHTTDLMNQPFQPAELDFPPPPIILPTNTSVTPSPHANATPRYMRSTINAVPTTSSLLKKSKLPFALVLQPFGSLHDAEDNIPVSQDQVIARCRRCRTYINPFVTFLDQGHKWKCNVCGLPNDVPQAFDWDAAAQKQLDRWNRYELNYGVTEFIAPQEYLVRPPQPLIYFFLFDVSYAAVSSGLLATAARCLAESLDRIPNADRRTRLGFLAVDSSLHYFTVPRDGSTHNDASMLVVSDLDEPFLPTPNDLLVTLSEARENIEAFLGKLQGMFQNTQTSGSAMGPALKAAHKVIAPMGGKITVLTASLPNIGDGKLEVRENKNVLGTSKEGSLLQTGSSFYKSFAVECSKNQVAIDMFLFSSSYQDVASMSNLPRYTAGQTWTYPGWNAARPEDAIKFASEFSNYLSMEVGLEAVLRVRATTGLRMNAFHGNFFYRSSDLCSFPSHPRDQAYVIEVAIDETLAKNVVYLQAGILYTTCNSERRVRVITLALPTTQIMADVYASADQGAITTYYSHKAVERVFNNGLDAARDALQTKAIEILQTYRKEVGSGAGGLSCPANLRSLPVLFLGLIKNVGLRKSSQIPSDIRSAALCLLSTLPIPLLLQFMYPRMYSLHDMPDDAGLSDEKTGQIIMPPTIPASSASLVPYGLYLIDDGQTQFLWLGREAVPQLVEDVFGNGDKGQLRVGKMTMPVVENDFNTRVRAVIEKSKDHLSRGMGSITVPFLYLVREDGEPSLRLWAQSLLVEDRSDVAPSLKQWLGMIREKSVQ